MLTIGRSTLMCALILSTGCIQVMAEDLASDTGSATTNEELAAANEAPSADTPAPCGGMSETALPTAGTLEVSGGFEGVDLETWFDYGDMKMTVTYAESAVHVTWRWPQDPAPLVASTSYTATGPTSTRVHTSFAQYGEYEYEIAEADGSFTSTVVLDTLDRRGLSLTPVHETVMRVAEIGNAAASQARWDIGHLQAGPVLASSLAEAAFLPLWNEDDPAEGGSVTPQVACQHRTSHRASCMQCCDDQYSENTAIWCRILGAGVTGAVILGTQGTGAVVAPYLGMLANAACSRAAYRGMKICRKECNEKYPSVASDNESTN